MPRHRKSATLLAGVLATVAMQATVLAGDELYRFSGKKQNVEPPVTPPQIQLRQEDQTPRQQAGQAARPAGSSMLNDKGGPPGTNQLPPGTQTPLPGGGPKLGVGPVGPGGTSRTSAVPNEGPNRYAGRPPSWENLNETDGGRNKNWPGQDNTSVASGYNIFGTTTVPFPVGPPKY